MKKLELSKYDTQKLETTFSRIDCAILFSYSACKFHIQNFIVNIQRHILLTLCVEYYVIKVRLNLPFDVNVTILSPFNPY